MLLLLLIASAFSTPVTAEQKVATTIAIRFASSNQPINVGCDTDPIAAQVGIRGWSPLCSHNTLTDVSKWLVYKGSTEIALEQSDYKNGATYRATERERKRFSNPETVIVTYTGLKPIALAALRQSSPERVEEIRTYINTALIPAFVDDVPPTLRELWTAESRADDAMLASRTYDGARTTWDPETEAAYKAANLAFGNAAIASGFQDPLALAWRLRREAEGGQKLVAAYRGIFTDFAGSI
jgi:hypothetical protein